MSAQVRIDDDVAAALDAAIKRAGGGQSRSHAANVRLRQALRLPLGVADSVGSAQERTQSVSRARATAARSTCRHPIARRIGDRCADCGAVVAAKR